MAAITMQSIHSLIRRLQKEYPQLSFESSTDFRWNPPERTVFYNGALPDTALLLHELAHALLDHRDYTRDIQLIEMESAAWEYAKITLSPKYQIAISDDIIQENLDSYRDWLHARSACPKCTAIGIQKKTDEYRCLACNTIWRVNNARACALRRYKTI